ncbi:MAG: hypothetical protein JWM44_3458 [Bacilli bacterium]|nr:hypothetical protein [Bacilli bacterium]
MGSIHKLVGLMHLFFANSKLVISRSMAYRFDFLVSALISLGLSSAAPLVQYLIFVKTQGYPGWTVSQLILFQGMVLITVGLRDTLFGNVRNNVMTLVRTGDFDRLLLKPYPPIGVILTGGFNINGIGLIITGFGIVAYSGVKLHLSFDFMRMLGFMGVVVSGLVFYMGILILFCGIVIMIIQMGRIGEFLDGLVKFSEYPLQIFPHFLRVAFVTIVPFALLNYYPAQILLNRVNSIALIAVFGSFIFFWLMLKWWNASLKKYTSAGG